LQTITKRFVDVSDKFVRLKAYSFIGTVWFMSSNECYTTNARLLQSLDTEDVWCYVISD